MNQNNKEKTRKEITNNLFREYKHLLFEMGAESKKHLVEADRFIAELKQKIEHPASTSTD